MTKAQFTTEDINAAVAQFTTETAPRTAPAVGKNSEVTIYGENPNKYKPVLPELQDDQNDKDETNVEIQGLDNYNFGNV